MYFFPNLEPVCCSMSGSNCCFLTCIQISQEVGKVVCPMQFPSNVFLRLKNRPSGFYMVPALHWKVLSKTSASSHCIFLSKWEKLLPPDFSSFKEGVGGGGGNVRKKTGPKVCCPEVTVATSSELKQGESRRHQGRTTSFSTVSTWPG